MGATVGHLTQAAQNAPRPPCRPQLAAAFFLLSGSLAEAVGVLAVELRDPQLALLVARLAEGPASPEAQRVVSQVRGCGCWFLIC